MIGYWRNFDGTWGNYTGTEYEIELQKGAQPYHAEPFPIPKVHGKTLKTGVDRLVSKGVLKRKKNLNGQRLHL